MVMNTILKPALLGYIISFIALLSIAIPKLYKDVDIVGVDFSLFSIIIPILFVVVNTAWFTIIDRYIPNKTLSFALLGALMGSIMSYISITADITYSIYNMENPNVIIPILMVIYTFIYLIFSKTQLSY